MLKKDTSELRCQSRFVRERHIDEISCSLYKLNKEKITFNKNNSPTYSFILHYSRIKNK